MINISLREQLLEAFDKLAEEQQKQVVGYIRSLNSELPPPIPGEVMLERARQINFDPADLAEMQQAIEEGCERIDWDGWK